MTALIALLLITNDVHEKSETVLPSAIPLRQNGNKDSAKI